MQNTPTYINSTLLSSYKNLMHAFSTKKGGQSLSPYLGNNLAFHVNDNADTVKQNHLQFSKELSYPIERLIRMDQVHGNTIIIIDKNSNINNVPQCDALITDLKNTPLMVMVADCIPILIYDPIREVIATVHAGRAGVFSKILPMTIQKMHEKYQSKTEDLRIVLGPSIHQCCYEVGVEIRDEAAKLSYEYAIKTIDSRYYLGLEKIIKKQLQELNIKEENIEFSPYCTSCNNDIFYSYRAANKSCGRFCGVMMLK